MCLRQCTAFAAFGSQHRTLSVEDVLLRLYRWAPGKLKQPVLNIVDGPEETDDVRAAKAIAAVRRAEQHTESDHLIEGGAQVVVSGVAKALGPIAQYHIEDFASRVGTSEALGPPPLVGDKRQRDALIAQIEREGPLKPLAHAFFDLPEDTLQLESSNPVWRVRGRWRAG